MLHTIADQTTVFFPNVSLLATQGMQRFRDRSVYGFDALTLKERRAREDEGRADPGHRPTRGRGGHDIGRRCCDGGRRGRASGIQLVDEPVDKLCRSC